MMENAILGQEGHEPRFCIQDYKQVNNVDFVSLEAATIKRLA